MWKLLTALFVLMCLGLLTVAGGIIWVFWNWGQDLPDYRQLAKYEPPVATRIHAGNGALLAEFASQKRVFVPVKSMPPQLVNAFLSAEDKAFYQHIGVDPLALARATVTNIINYGSGRRPVGASTITQQVAKNFLLTNELSLDRKIKEAILAIRMERAFSKDQIMALYLNEIYLGAASYGVAAAALNYFDKALDELELHEMAYIAALPKAPSNYHPVKNTRAALGRRNWVLTQMYRNGFIEEADAKAAQLLPLGVRPRTGFDSASAPYFTEEVRRIIKSEYGDKVLYEGGLSVRTTIDPHTQKLAERAMREGLEALDRRQGWRGALAQRDDSLDIDQQLDVLTASLPNLRYAALVTSVSASDASIYVNGSTGRIPFALARWAYPPRREDGVRPPKITALTEALSVGDIVIVQPPSEAPDLASEEFTPEEND
ncbi:MAG: transglycosylase domain-containing protein, partial [Candidatus Puniceispirillaceae bacterium]